MRISEMRLLDIVNVKDGRRLGNIKDLELDLERGVIKSITLPGVSKNWGFFGRGGSDDIVVPWDRVKKIGIDVVLVDVQDLPGFDYSDER